MMARMLAAIQFLTLLPVAGKTASPSEAAIFFPVLGAALGAVAGLVCEAAIKAFGRSLAAFLAIAFLIAVTGALHEDGLADVADAFRAGRSHERMMAILKDSRIGTYGGLALVLSVLMRGQAIANAHVSIVPALAAALGLSRASLVVLAAITPTLGNGLGTSFARGITRPVLYAVLAQMLVIAVALAHWRAPAMFLASACVILVSRAYFIRRAGGVNGDCLGATCQVVETANLLVLAWQPSF